MGERQTEEEGHHQREREIEIEREGGRECVRETEKTEAPLRDHTGFSLCVCGGGEQAG